MFNRKTLFVIGAGAGFDIGMPVGRTLADDIARRVGVSVRHDRLWDTATADKELALCFFERGDRNSREYARAFKLIHDGVLLANSIDDFLNVHDGDPQVVSVGKTAIVRSILNAERHSSLYVEVSLHDTKLDVARIRDTWLVKFIQTLVPGRKVHEVEDALQNVSFINFNYDRCLEYFLRHALTLAYGVTTKQAASIVASADIIHPYGSVGTLESVPFGQPEFATLDYRDLSVAIKTYTERIEERSILERMQTAIKEAECVVFLGFAYHKQNMALLKPPKPQNTRDVYGTAFGMSASDVSQVVSELDSFFSEPILVATEAAGGIQAGFVHKNIRIENQLTCAQLFDYYAKSLAG
jgi:hypothetical protein